MSKIKSKLKIGYLYEIISLDKKDTSISFYRNNLSSAYKITKPFIGVYLGLNKLPGYLFKDLWCQFLYNGELLYINKSTLRYFYKCIELK